MAEFPPAKPHGWWRFCLGSTKTTQADRLCCPCVFIISLRSFYNADPPQWDPLLLNEPRAWESFYYIPLRCPCCENKIKKIFSTIIICSRMFPVWKLVLAVLHCLSVWVSWSGTILFTTILLVLVKVIIHTWKGYLV